MAGIKFHGAIDTEISGNHIYRTHLCASGSTGWRREPAFPRNLLHDNRPPVDVFGDS